MNDKLLEIAKSTTVLKWVCLTCGSTRILLSSKDETKDMTNFTLKCGNHKTVIMVAGHRVLVVGKSL